MKLPHRLFRFSNGIRGLLLCSLSASGISADPGDVIWSQVIGEILFSAPAIAADGTVIIGAQDGSLYAFNPDGSFKWSSAISSDWIDASATISTNGTVYTASWDGSVYALNASDGSLEWTRETGGFIVASPAIGPDGTVYVGSNDGFMYAFSPDGAVLWATDSSGALEPVNGAPVLNEEGSSLYFGTDSGTLYAINTADGSLRWSFAAADLHPPGSDESAEISSSPSVSAGGVIYVTSENGYLYALSANGELLWHYRAAESIRSSVVISETSELYFAAQDGYLYALDSEGFQLWEAFVGDVFYSTPALDRDGNIIVGGYAGSEATGAASRIVALNPDGDVLWEFLFSEYHDSSPNIAPDGSILFGAHNGILYKLEGTAPLLDEGWPRVQGNRWNTGRHEPRRIPELIDFFPAITYSRDGWSYVPWFGSGWINDRGLPWIQHVDHGYLFLDTPSPFGAWAFDSRLNGWIYGPVSTPNYYFNYATQSWLYHIPGSTTNSGRWFYDFATEGWFSDLGM